MDIFVPRVGDASTRLARALSEFLGINELIRNKRAVGRHVDLADVEQLLRIRSERNV